jgi:predicted ATPase/DNA-binding CsgD family transcriptional regulator
VGAAVAATEGMHGFTSALTSFVGRDGEVAQVAGLLAEYRLVTVTGPGGIGKTRLAAEVARAVAGRFADGIWLVELAAVSDSGQVAAAVAAALGVARVPGLSVIEALAAVLSRQQLLVVLDNCEHVVIAVAELCRALLLAADDLRVLATSREPVGLAGEARFRLRPLPVSGAGTSSGQEMPAAMKLFADRARQADPRFDLDSDSERMAARLVERLDGMPLAIELAAARIEALGLGLMLDRLEDSLLLLVSPDRATAPRHQSLAATVEWSYLLLSEEEQRIFRRLSIFPGLFTLDAAVTVAGAGTEPLILHLVDCSLLNPPRVGPDGRVRYLMPETIRVFGVGRLAGAGEETEAAAALARHTLAVAEEAAAGMRTRDEVAAVRRLDAEATAIHQALTWALEHDPDTALRLGVALAKWWILRGRREAGRAMLLAAAEHAAPGSPNWCQAQFWLGDMGPVAKSLGHETAAYEVLATQGPSPLLAEVLAGRSRTLMYLGQISEAASDARKALDVARQISYPAGEILALAQLSRTAHYAGDTSEALERARQAQRVLASGELGWTLRFTGNFIIEVLIESGDLPAARQSLADSLAWMEQAGDRTHQITALALMADLEFRAGDIAASGERLREAAELAIVTGARDRLLRCLDLFGYLCAAKGQDTQAVTIWTAFQTGLTAEGSHDMPLSAERRQEPLRKAVQALGPARSQAAQDRGAAMAVETAGEFALMAGSTDVQPSPAPESPSRLNQLSPREQELVSLVAKGRTDAQIAGQLYISVSTVRSHLDRVRDKTGSRRRADLTRLALQAGLI